MCIGQPCFSFDDQNGAPIKKKKDYISVWYIDGNTLCWQMAKSEKKDVEGSFGTEKVYTLRKRKKILTIGENVNHGYIWTWIKIVQFPDLPEERTTKRSASCERTSVSLLFFFFQWHENFSTMKHLFDFFFLVTFLLYLQFFSKVNKK